MATKKDKTIEEKKGLAQKNPLIIGARITEKAALGIDRGVYTFNISPRATKSEIKKAIKALYKVDAVKVNIAKTSNERVVVRGKKGLKAGLVKAYVYLKKGDKINIEQ